MIGLPPQPCRHRYPGPWPIDDPTALSSPHQDWPLTNEQEIHHCGSAPCDGGASSPAWREPAPGTALEVPDASVQTWPAARSHPSTGCGFLVRNRTESFAVAGGWPSQGDLGYESGRVALTTPIKHTAGRRLTADQAHGQRAPAGPPRTVCCPLQFGPVHGSTRPALRHPSTTVTKEGHAVLPWPASHAFVGCPASGDLGRRPAAVTARLGRFAQRNRGVVLGRSVSAFPPPGQVETTRSTLLHAARSRDVQSLAESRG